ncbi:MAG: hypothetical protein H7250_08950 [Flavobacterium sp.]|nr:hypothetical protein [Flavobacterium sp.]
MNRQQKTSFNTLMIKTFVLLFALFSISISIIAQSNYSGKYYVAQIGATCKEMPNGGCMIYSHCIMKFDKDSVEVSYPTIASCTSTKMENNYNSNNLNLTKKYKWIITSDKLVINDFKDYNKYSFQEKSADFVKTLYPKEYKYYLATITDARLMDEPCHEVSYCVLKFAKDSVEVSYPIKGYCTSVELSNKYTTQNKKMTKKYRWVVLNGAISIPKFEKYNEYNFEEKEEEFIKTLFP